MVHQVAQKSLIEHPNLRNGYISAVVAAILLRYVASVGKPGVLHVVLALTAVFGVVGAYLSIGRSNIEPGLKAGNIIGAAVVAGVFYMLTSLIF